jgi:hypothetical protein
MILEHPRITTYDWGSMFQHEKHFIIRRKKPGAFGLVMEVHSEMLSINLQIPKVFTIIRCWKIKACSRRSFRVGFLIAE